MNMGKQSLFGNVEKFSKKCGVYSKQPPTVFRWRFDFYASSLIRLFAQKPDLTKIKPRMHLISSSERMIAYMGTKGSAVK